MISVPILMMIVLIGIGPGAQEDKGSALPLARGRASRER